MTDERDTYVHIILCSEYNPEFKLVCDERKGHQGAHAARVLWLGDEDESEGETT